MSGTAAAQGAFGIGGRISFVRTDVELEDEESRRFWGGQIRARMSPRTAFELSLDLRTETNEAETLRVRSTAHPGVAAAVPGAGRVLAVRPRRRRVVFAEVRDAGRRRDAVLSETVREFGWHAGFGAELRMGNHAGLHGDYRYTFLDFGGRRR